MFTAAVILIISFAISWLSLSVIIRRCKGVGKCGHGQLHHTHRRAVPRFGGVALVVPFVLSGLAMLFTLPHTDGRTALLVTVLATGTAMFGLGFLDDLRSLGAKRKLILQVVIAVAAYHGGVQINTLKNPFTLTVYELNYLAIPVTVFWLVALTNIMNLIDGIDGLAGGIGLMLMALLVYVGSQSGSTFSFVCAAGMCGALIGFLCFNFPPAKIYMGDGGAYFLGFLIGALSIVDSNKGVVTAALIAPAFALALPIIDVTLAITRRGLKGLPIFRPDKKHLHHRLLALGFSRRQTVLLLYCVSLLFLSMGFGTFVLHQNWMPLLIGVSTLILLLAARQFSFSQEWQSAGKVLGNSLDARKEVQYTMMLGKWLVLESDRCESIDSLWADFKFMVRKIRFSKVELHLDGATYCWKTEMSPNQTDELHSIRHDLPGDHTMSLEIHAHSALMPKKDFELLSELIAESWLKACVNLKTNRNKILEFESVRAARVPLAKSASLDFSTGS